MCKNGGASWTTCRTSPKVRICSSGGWTTGASPPTTATWTDTLCIPLRYVRTHLIAVPREDLHPHAATIHNNLVMTACISRDCFSLHHNLKVFVTHIDPHLVAVANLRPNSCRCVRCLLPATLVDQQGGQRDAHQVALEANLRIEIPTGGGGCQGGGSKPQPCHQGSV